MATFRSAGDLKSGKQCGVGSAAQHGIYLGREYSMDTDGNKHPRFTEEIAGDLNQLVLITENVMTAKYRFIPATIGFTQEESNRLSDDEIRGLALNYAEHLASPLGLERVPFSIQKHTNKETSRVDLHITLARYDLQMGKTFQPYVETREPRKTRAEYGDGKRLQVFQAIQTIKFHLDDPNDPLRIRWTKERDNLPKERKKLIAEINQYVEAYVKCGAVKNRDDVLGLLHSMGFDTPRAGAGYITVKKSYMKKGVRLMGAAYNASFAGFVEPSEPEQSETERMAELQQQLDDIDKHRCPCFEKHFRQPKSKAISQNKKQDKTSHEPVATIPDAVSDQRYFNASEPCYGTPSGRKAKRRIEVNESAPVKHAAQEQSRPAGAGVVKPWHRIRIIDLCQFDKDLQKWAYQAFPHIFVTDLGSQITHHGTESEWKLAAALAAAKDWEAVHLHCASMESARIAIKHHQTFGIEITAITIGNTELSAQGLNELLEKYDEHRNRVIESESLCRDGTEDGGNNHGNGADTERQQRIGELCDQIAEDRRGLREGQQRSQKTNAGISKAIIALDKVSAAIERWGVPGIK